MKIQVSQMALKCIKKTLSSKCCMNCLENHTTVVVITQLNMPLEAVSSVVGERETKKPSKCELVLKTKVF